jgi:hypothetical protein
MNFQYSKSPLGITKVWYFGPGFFTRHGLTRAKALQTVSRFPRETRRRYAATRSNTFTLK